MFAKSFQSSRFLVFKVESMEIPTAWVLKIIYPTLSLLYD